MSERAFTAAMMALSAGLGAILLQVLKWAFERVRRDASDPRDETNPPPGYKSRSSVIASVERSITHVKEIQKMAEDIRRDTARIPAMAAETHDVREIVAQVDDDRVPLVYSRKSLERAIERLTAAATAQTAVLAELVAKLT